MDRCSHAKVDPGTLRRSWHRYGRTANIRPEHAAFALHDTQSARTLVMSSGVPSGTAPAPAGGHRPEMDRPDAGRAN